MKKYLLLLILLIPFGVLAKGYEIVSGDLNTAGSVVKIADEEFYVIGKEDDTHIKLLSKYNLGVGLGYDTPTNKQDSTAGVEDGDDSGYFKKGGVIFSETKYWLDSNNQLKTKYSTDGEFPYVYDNNSTLYTYVENYNNYLKEQGVCVNSRLVSNDDLYAVGCNSICRSCYVNSIAYSCNNAASWLDFTNADFWSGNINIENNYEPILPYVVAVSKSYQELHGVRPLVILDISDSCITEEPVKEVVKGKTEEVKENPKTGVNKHLFVVLIVMLLLTIVYLRLYDIKFFKKI